MPCPGLQVDGGVVQWGCRGVPLVEVCSSALVRREDSSPPEGRVVGGLGCRWNKPFRDCAMGAVLLGRGLGLTIPPWLVLTSPATA